MQLCDELKLQLVTR